MLRSAESLSKLSLIQVDEVLIPRSLENTKLANPLNLLNLDLVRMWDFAQLHQNRIRKMDKQRTNSSTPHLHPKSLELALNSSFVKNACSLAQEYSLTHTVFFRSCSKILARRRWPWQFRKPYKTYTIFW